MVASNRGMRPKRGCMDAVRQTAQKNRVVWEDSERPILFTPGIYPSGPARLNGHTKSVLILHNGQSR